MFAHIMNVVGGSGFNVDPSGLKLDVYITIGIAIAYVVAYFAFL